MVMIYVILILIVIYIISRTTCGVTNSKMCLIGRTILVTGANSGIGFQVALNLASRGCRLILADVADMEETKNYIVKRTNNQNIVLKHLDLGSFKSIRAVVKDIKQTEEKIDVLVNNAGVGFLSGCTEDGLQKVMQINYLGHVLLTVLLVDCLKKSDDARVIFTSSLYCFVNDLSSKTFKDDCLRKTKERITYYGNTKLSLIIAAKILAEKLKPFKIKVNSLHPGLARTVIFQKASDASENLITYAGAQFTQFMSWFYGKTAEEAAQTTIHLASSEEVKDVTGKFFLDCHVSDLIPRKGKSFEYCKKIWDISEELICLSPEEKI